jgi:hypothetical protein
VAIEVEKLSSKEAEQRRGGKPSKAEKPTQIIESVSRNERTAADQAATMTGTNRQYVSDVKKLSGLQYWGPLSGLITFICHHHSAASHVSCCLIASCSWLRKYPVSSTAFQVLRLVALDSDHRLSVDHLV